VSGLRRALRAYPALLRIGLAEAVAYRTEFVVWMLTTTMPLVMLALWTAVARGGVVAGDAVRFGSSDFVAYYLAALIVRTVTGTWVVWEMNQEIRTGTMSLRLLRPLHPLIAYSAEHLAAVPLRALLALPVAIIMLAAAGGGHLVSDPVLVGVLFASLAGAWLIMFMSMVAIGALGMFIDKSVAVFEVWLGIFGVMSGYMIPLGLMPGWVRTVADWLPFRYMLGFPVETMIGMTTRASALRSLAVQWGYVVVFVAVALAVWRAGVKRFQAFGA
jgi:ABC-2 type transport system permease protein